MAGKAAQRNVGVGSKRRGQETGLGEQPDQGREAKNETPAISGSRKSANKMSADKSKQQMASDATSARSNVPSVAGQTDGGHPGEPLGERVFKKRQAKSRTRK